LPRFDERFDAEAHHPVEAVLAALFHELERPFLLVQAPV